MLAKSLSEIFQRPVEGEDKVINGLALDSRLVKDNYLFLAVKGEKLDGHDYINQAIEKGATAIALENDVYVKHSGISYVKFDGLKAEVGKIASRFYGSPTQSMCVIGVTGTNGKTSISHYISQLFEILGSSCGVIGTLGIEYKDNRISINNTTPDAITLQKTFNDMLHSDVKNVAMEVSSHALTQSRCSGIKFNTAIISNVTHDHLDYHGDFDSYMNAKLTLFTMPELRVAIINADDGSADKICRVVNPSLKLMRYSLSDKTADAYLTDINISSNGYSVKLQYSGRVYSLKIPLLGEFNLYNVLAALLAVSEQGYDMEKVSRAIEKLKPVPGRMQLVPNQSDIIAVVDYAHTPDALENVLLSLRKQVSGKIIVVFGCGGDRDKEKRPKMADIAMRFSDLVIITADNPRNEKLEDILSDIESGISGKKYEVIPERDKAIMFAVNQAIHNDCVLVAGKGHEKTQIIGNVIKPFDDVEVLAEALAKKQETVC
jgi:UDP-N-acetylmuramoyl-L-alanyl-D-glutamate--2,6-diaminopimelate ligase